MAGDSCHDASPRGGSRKEYVAFVWEEAAVITAVALGSHGNGEMVVAAATAAAASSSFSTEEVQSNPSSSSSSSSLLSLFFLCRNAVITAAAATATATATPRTAPMPYTTIHADNNDEELLI